MNHDDNNDALWAAISRIEISVIDVGTPYALKISKQA